MSSFNRRIIGMFRMSAMLVGAMAVARSSQAVVVFSAPIPIKVSGSSSLATADFDGDDRADLVVGHGGDQNVSVILSRPDGTFSVSDYDAGLSIPPYYVLAGDMNGDGKIDILTSNSSNRNFTILNGKGDGAFSSPILVSVNNLYNSKLKDLNSDGKFDIISSGITVSISKGDGTFLSKAYTTASGYTIDVFDVTDYNKDGKSDIIGIDNHGGFQVLIGNGDGTFQLLDKGSTQVGGGIFGDLDNDGIDDLLTANQAFLSNGDGTFKTPVNLPPYAGGIQTFGDFNKDGNLDAVLVNQGIGLLLGDGSGLLQTKINLPMGFFPSSVVVGDFNGDGKPDLAVSNGSDTVSILLNQTPLPAPVPLLRISKVGGLAAPSTPIGSASSPDVLLPAGTNISSVPVEVTGQNIPAGSTVSLFKDGLETSSGTLSNGVKTFSIALPANPDGGGITISKLQAVATLPVSAALAKALPQVKGVQIVKMQLIAAPGKSSTFRYLSSAGKGYTLAELMQLSRG